MISISRFLAGLLLAAVIAMTFAPIEFRPIAAAQANLDRAATFAVLGVLLTFAFPRGWLIAIGAAVIFTGILEIGQAFTATRHACYIDFLVKASAASIASLSAAALIAVLARFDNRLTSPN